MTPIAPLITRFLREHMPVEQGYSPHTGETYAHAFRLLFGFASERLRLRPSQLSLEQIDAALVLDFLAISRNSAATGPPPAIRGSPRSRRSGRACPPSACNPRIGRLRP
jgi:integrase/recombinase XerD